MAKNKRDLYSNCKTERLVWPKIREICMVKSKRDLYSSNKKAFYGRNERDLCGKK